MIFNTQIEKTDIFHDFFGHLGALCRVTSVVYTMVSLKLSVMILTSYLYFLYGLFTFCWQRPRGLVGTFHNDQHQLCNDEGRGVSL